MLARVLPRLLTRPTWRSLSTSATTRKLNVAILGATGRMGRIRCALAHESPLYSITHVVDLAGSTSPELNTLAKAVHATPCDVDAFMEDTLHTDAVDAVIISTPTSVHAEQIKACLNAGKPVLAEKPVGINPEEIASCFEVAERVGLPLFCAYQRHMDASFARARELIHAGTIGQVMLVRMSSRDHPPPPLDYTAAGSTGTFFDDFATHDVAMARWLLQEEPEDVYAVASRLLSPAVDDTAAITLRMPSGTLVMIDNSRRTTYGYDTRAEILGSEGMIRVANPHASNVTFANEEGFLASPLDHSFPERYHDAYSAELDSFVEVVRGNAELTTSGNDCVRAAELTAACQASRLEQVPPQPEIEELPDQEILATVLGSERKFGVAVFGCGRMGKERARWLDLEEDCDVLHIIDAHEPTLTALATSPRWTHTRPQAHADLDAALSDPNVDAIFVCSTSSAHKDAIMRSLAAGKHVFCEKPLVLNSSDAVECYQRANDAQRMLYCGFHRRWDPHHGTVARMAREGHMGNIELLLGYSRDAAGLSSDEYYASSGSIFFDSLIHDFDACRYVFDAAPTEIFCQASAFIPVLKEMGQIDTAAVTLRFPSGGIAMLDCNRRAVYGYDQRLEIMGSLSLAEAHNPPITNVVVSGANGHTTDRQVSECTDRYHDAFREETRHFLAAAKGDVDALVRPSEVIDGLRIAELAQLSYEQGKRVSWSPAE